MGTIATHKTGSFCWIELGTTDQAAAKRFYASLFGWGSNDFPMGPDGMYTIFSLTGRDTGGGFTLMPDMIAHGVPPHWLLYVLVDSADDAVAQAQAAGARVMKPAIDVSDFGRMAVLQDPTGAVFAVWQVKRQPEGGGGIRVAGEAGAFCWADLITHDPDAAKKFYETLFGWRLSPGEKDQSGYLHIQNGADFIGGVPPSQYVPPNVPPHWLLYFQVANCDQATAKAQELGARVLVEPMSMENVGRWSVIADPQGAGLALFEPAQHS
jgi:uncharacterized protein